MIEWLRLSFSFGQSDFCLALSCIDWVVPALSLFSSPLFSSLLSFFSSILLSSLLPCRLIWWPHPCLTALSLSPFASVLSPSLYLVGLVASSPPRSLSLSCIGWVAVSISCVGWVASLSFSCAGWITFPLSVSLSLSSLFGFGWVASPFTCVCSVVSPIPSSLVCWLGGVCSPLSVYTLSSVAWVASCPSVSLSLSLSLSLARIGGLGSFLLVVAGWLLPPLSCVVGRRLLSLSLSLGSLSLRLF